MPYLPSWAGVNTRRELYLHASSLLPTMVLPLWVILKRLQAAIWLLNPEANRSISIKEEILFVVIGMVL
jgi:hypothetical protein